MTPNQRFEYEAQQSSALFWTMRDTAPEGEKPRWLDAWANRVWYATAGRQRSVVEAEARRVLADSRCPSFYREACEAIAAAKPESWSAPILATLLLAFQDGGEEAHDREWRRLAAMLLGESE